MRKTKLLGLSIIVLSLFFAAPRVIDAQFPIATVCQLPLTTFSNGSATFDVSFPPGGGMTCDTIADCPKISLPANATVYSMKVDMELSDPASEIGTPFIWVPLSATNGLVQIKTSDGSFVSKFTNANILDCTANCDTNTPTWVIRGASLCNFSNPSRITVIPGGDVWIANRGSSVVTWVGLVDPIASTEEYECKANKNVGPGARGVTFDVQGNIWVGDNGDNFVWKFNSDGTYAWPAPHKVNIGCTTYGMIADAFGNVWVSSGGCDAVLRIDINNCDNMSCPTSTTSGFTTGSTPYGIGMDNEGDIWTGDWTGNGAHEIDGGDTGGILGNVVSNCLTPGAGCCTGTAVDKDNNVWTSGHSENKIYLFKNGNCGNRYEKSAVCTKGNKYPHGIAIDFDNHAWAVCRQGEVIKYEFDGANINELKRINLNGAGSGSSDSASYNYSDMTGLRTIPKFITVGSSPSISLSDTNTFEICTDGIEDCANPASSSTDCNSKGISPVACATPDAMGNCEIPLKIFSVTAGDYTLKNLEVIYGKDTPMTYGGIVPCGRNWDDPATAWNDKAPCNFCFLLMMINNIMNFLIMLASGIAVLFLIITGLLYITSSGDAERKSKAKTAFKYTLIGYIIIFVAWIILDFFLIAFGYLDPLGGEWNVVNCDVDTSVVVVPPPVTFCGDGTRQTPNSAGFDEECDTDGSSCGSLVCNADCTCKTDPTPGVCGVWFSGIMAGNPDGGKPNSFMSPFELMRPTDPTVQMANWVANGNYPDNSLAFHEADLNSFDGMAVDKNTRLELWDDTDYKNKDGTTTPIIDITGPAIINNIHWLWVGGFYDAYYIDTNCFGLDQTVWTDCRFSDLNGNGTYDDTKENMHSWGEGSCEITCTAAAP